MDMPAGQDLRENVPRVAATLRRLASRESEVLHRHDAEHQLKWASTGVLTVPTERGTWVVPPRWALWIPAGLRHGGVATGEVLEHNLYVDQRLGGDLPGACCTFPCTPRLRCVLLEIGARAEPGEGRTWLSPREAAHVLPILREDIAPTSRKPVALPIESHGLVAVLFDALSEGRGLLRSESDWARAFGLGTRSFARLVHREAGTSFGTCRTRIQLVRALRLLGLGREVRSVARELGYGGSAAFVAMFRRNLGVTPGRYYDV